MAVTFQSKEQAKEKTSKKAASDVVEIVEEMAGQKIELNAFKKLEKKYNDNRDTLKSMIPDDAEEGDPVVFTGNKHAVEFSACGNVRTITDMKMLHKKLGDEVFYALATVKLTDLDKYLSVEEQEDFVVTSQTGSRTCSVKEI